MCVGMSSRLCAALSVPGKIISDTNAWCGKRAFCSEQCWEAELWGCWPGACQQRWDGSGDGVADQKLVLCGYLELSSLRPFLLLFTCLHNHLVYLYTDEYVSILENYERWEISRKRFKQRKQRLSYLSNQWCRNCLWEIKGGVHRLWASNWCCEGKGEELALL